MACVPDDQHWMRQALTLAARGRGWVEPNPMVGAVIVHQNQLYATGWHRRFGGPHAEINALAACPPRTPRTPRTPPRNLRGGTLYVTLEPCCHQGKTGPCTDAILKAGLARVVVAMTDPFSAVAGQGIAQLRQAGVRVDVGVCETEARLLNEAYLKRVQTGLPWIIAKWAQTLDGYIATPTKHSQWISNPASRRLVHQWRSRVDAIMVGIGTVLADDPLLTARQSKPRRIATRIVVDPQLKLPLDCRLVKSLQVAPLLVMTDREKLKSPAARRLTRQGVTLMGLARHASGTLRMKTGFKRLAREQQMTNILVEGGRGLFSDLFKQKSVDQVLAFVCPTLLGDDHAITPLRGRSCSTIRQGLALHLQRTRKLQEDMLLDYRVHARP